MPIFNIYEVLHEDINIDSRAEMIKHEDALRTHLVLNHKAKVLPRSSFTFYSPKG